MITYKEIKEVIKVPEKFVCDICGEEQLDLDIDEMHHIHFVGGYNSRFGDMNDVKCDICHKCLYKMIGNKCRYNEDEDRFDDNLNYFRVIDNE